MSKASSRGRAGTTTTTSEIERVRAKLRAKGNIARALVNFRAEEDPEAHLRLVPTLARHPAYAQAIIRDPFPRSYDRKSGTTFPFYLGLKREVTWTSSLLLAYADEINDFVRTRDELDRQLLVGDAEAVAAVIQKAEVRFGVSLWLFDAQANHAQTTGGVTARNRILRKATHANDQNQLLTFVAVWLAYRCDPDLSPAAVDVLLSENATPDSGVALLVHLLLGRTPRVSEEIASEIISYSDTFSLVDRYQILLLTLQNLSTTENVDEETKLSIRTSLDRLNQRISDGQLARLCTSWEVGRRTMPDPQFLEALDHYTNGDYAWVVDSVARADPFSLTIEWLHLAIRAANISHLPWDKSKLPPLKGGLLADIAADLFLVTSLSAEGVDARLRLEKLVQRYSGSSWSASISCILERQRSDERVFPSGRAQVVASLRSQVELPSLAFYLPRDRLESEFQAVFRDHRRSAGLDGLSLLTDRPTPGLTELPAERVARMLALRAARVGDLPLAVTSLEQAARADNPTVMTLEAEVLLVSLYLQQGEITKAADLSAELFVRSRYFGLILPIERVVSELLKTHDEPMTDTSPRGRLSTAIVFDIYSRFVGPNRDAERADAFKDVLSRRRVRRASELINSSDKSERESIVYFLRYICVPDVLDQSLNLPSTRDVEDERARILIGLSELSDIGRAASGAIKEELSAIRTRQIVRETALQLDQSKVYVNVEGIRRTLDVGMRENWNRYRLAQLQSGEDEVLEKLQQIIKTTSGDRVTIIQLRTPLTEANALFQRMVAEIGDQFTSNKEFGLNANLSTNIRHGYVLRELRGPLIARSLITNRTSDAGNYQSNSYWLDRLDEDVDVEELTNILNEFSKRVDDEIDDLTRRVLQIRSEKTPDGLFSYVLSETNIRLVEQSWRELETYEDFILASFDSFWQVTEQNLQVVRQHLMTSVLSAFNRALNDFEGALRKNDFDTRIPSLVHAITAARQDVRAAIERVSSWFTLSRNQEYQDYDIEIAYQAGLNSVKSYYANITIHSILDLQGKKRMLDGWTLPYFSRLFFLILDNAAYHGAKNRSVLNVRVNVTFDEEMLALVVKNDLDDDHDLHELANRVAAINDEYGKPGAAEKVGIEGGSGYAKIWKILNFDLRQEHALAVSMEGQQFVVEVICDAAGLVK